MGVQDKRGRTSFWFYCLLFFLFSFIGWVWEVLLFLVKEGRFVNRGVLFGPWLPIYGAGGLLLCFLVGGRRKNPVAVFFLSLIVCSVLEYMMSWFLEALWGIRWWDYSGCLLNLNGRICLWGSLMFGVAGLALVYLLLPLCRRGYARLPDNRRKVICLVLLLLFVLDATYAAIVPNLGSGISGKPFPS